MDGREHRDGKEHLDEQEHRITKQPNSRHCFVCGVENQFGLHIKFYETGPGEVTAECTIPDQYQGYPGIVHGGIVAALLDEVAGRSQMGTVGNPRFMFTASLKVRYRKNVPVGRPLRIVGQAGTARKRVAEATAAIYDPQGELLAEGEAILVNVPPETIASVDLDSLGWRVYPDETPEEALSGLADSGSESNTAYEFIGAGERPSGDGS